MTHMIIQCLSILLQVVIVAVILALKTKEPDNKVASIDALMELLDELPAEHVKEACRILATKKDSKSDEVLRELGYIAAAQVHKTRRAQQC